jgi:pimeloyl-ACP methyl ester carboxylesterase
MRFVLIHGGFHGAWCWERVIGELEGLGHEAIAIDLPGHGQRRDERSTLADRRDAITAVLQPGDVLVGHSGGGYDITLAADAAPDKIRHLVYLAAGLPIEGKTVLDATGGAPSQTESEQEAGVSQLMDDETGMSKFVRPNATGRMECYNYSAVRDFFYHDVDEETAAWAYFLLTPAPVEFLVETVHVPSFWAADMPRSYIRCLEDRAKPLSASLECIRRLGVSPLTIESSHSPFLSRPAQLARLLAHAATTTPVGPLLPS